jgi:hypothetical protein
MPPKNNAQAVRKSQEEVSLLQNQLSEIENQLHGEQNSNEKLRHLDEQQDEKIVELEAAIREEKALQKQRVQALINERVLTEERSHARLRELNREESDLNAEAKRYTVLLRANEKLMRELKQISYKHFTMSHEMKDQESEIGQRNFDRRIKLDQILRNMIKAFAKKYQETALEQLDKEAVAAKKENVKLFADSDHREKICAKLIEKQKQSYDRIMKLRIVKEVESAAAVMHMKSQEGLEIETSHQELTIQDIKYDIEELKDGMKRLKLEVQRKKRLQKSLKKLQGEINAIKEYKQYQFQTAMGVAKQLLEEGLEIASKDRSYHNCQLADSFVGALGMDGPPDDPVGMSPGVSPSLNRVMITEEPQQAPADSMNYEKIWNSNYCDVNIMTTPLRRLVSRANN